MSDRHRRHMGQAPLKSHVCTCGKGFAHGTRLKTHRNGCSTNAGYPITAVAVQKGNEATQSSFSITRPVVPVCTPPPERRLTEPVDTGIEEVPCYSNASPTMNERGPGHFCVTCNVRVLQWGTHQQTARHCELLGRPVSRPWVCRCSRRFIRRCQLLRHQKSCPLPKIASEECPSMSNVARLPDRQPPQLSCDIEHHNRALHLPLQRQPLWPLWNSNHEEQVSDGALESIKTNSEHEADERCTGDKTEQREDCILKKILNKLESIASREERNEIWGV
ncbi:hypothetical protein M409DRAFT_61396 [Zasmidium cellare ATCC 36951]|uniref:Uncharacterized protein n=1 Tax=Zasmidium cellare ATCC 36951 TaxID=1080233 RepID=A0A6A6BVB2_ZASCE|nr:uncharacterized protein M409DRAFT_61396 [Zasmidium cellare ATCC 36951]KAF2158737.1 hypothetical protein M409DRAFT_61396 [Zasmidium cellare ATCC 36951]